MKPSSAERNRGSRPLPSVKRISPLVRIHPDADGQDTMRGRAGADLSLEKTPRAG